jgi:hypothetical protein
MPDKLCFDDILVGHWIKFEYDTKKSLSKKERHYLFKVEDTIHYRSLVEDKYCDYEKLITTTKQKEHSLNKFLKLRDEFDVDKLVKNKIVLRWDKQYEKYLVLDGCHRLAIIMYKKLHNNNELNLDWFVIKK